VNDYDKGLARSVEIINGVIDNPSLALLTSQQSLGILKSVIQEEIKESR
jgi:hypothetical protein